MKKTQKNNGIYKSAGVLAAGAFLLFGRYLVSRLVSNLWGKKLRWQPAAECQYIKCPSGNVLYAEFDGPADGVPMVFIHGINANHTQWYYQRNYFKQRYRLIFFTLPLTGNDGGFAQLATDVLADDIHYALQMMNIATPVFYGHSMGGMVLLRYCAKYQSNVKAIILQGASYTNPVLTNPYAYLLKPLQKPVLIPFLNFVKKHNRFFTVLSYINYLNGLSCLGFRFVLFSGNQTANELLYASSMGPSNDTGAVAESVLQLMQFDVTRELKHIHVPALIICGIYDRFNTVQCNEYLHRKLPQSQLRLIAGGHQGMVENHEEVNGLISQFLGQFS